LKAVELSRHLDQEGATASRDAIKKQMDEAATRLDEAQARLLEFQTANNLDLLEQDTQSRLSNRTTAEWLEIDIEAEKARLSRMEEELAQQPRLLDVRHPNTPDRILQSGTATPLESSMGANSVNPLANPVYTQLQYEVAQSKAKLSGLEQQVRRIRVRNQADSKMMGALYRRRMELKRLAAISDVSQRVYDEFATQYEAARGRVVGIIPQLQIVDVPVQPDGSLSRNLPQYAILGGVVGLVGGAIIALVLNRRRSIQAVS
jgi:uncharacterized protein involved in exopolysaccharide biosynthesis